ncbi:DUF418 domain-containing protein [Deinococcus sp. KSM4-11]|uniref:DUF418 domain-containing protein n=1 Tax=Deinococcus sp. KSM4-11 TaxID=2568654 RepID=UPI0010A3B183|nr:DUF418 domain-containing protein [Deinococcus sp. KSM4-11]THF86457.1 DUF418 domain-containing protein [Deinococcus sp. KSM4-11]
MTVLPPPQELEPGPAAPPPEAGPLAARGPVQRRSPLPDVLRGVALAGILIVNMQDFAGFREWTQTGPDRVAQVITDTLANGRFISIFAMLFGWGAAGLIARQGPWTFLRRHAVLLAVGAAHYVLVWHGDIISLYALLGVLVLLTARLEAPALVGLAAVLGSWWLGLTLLAGLDVLGEAAGRFSGLPELLPSYAGNVSLRATEFGPLLIGSAVYNGPWLLALFCLGAAAQRTGLLLHPQEHRPLLRRLAVGGLSVGLPLGALLAYLNTRPEYAAGLLAIPVRMGGGLASALGYVGVLGLLAAAGRLGAWRHFAASGRLAMSNYLTQSVVMTSVFYPYAGAQWGRWGALGALALALAFGLLQLPVSAWWLRRTGTGPMEWLVRAVVYGRISTRPIREDPK